jgi:hypothetical protein
MASAALARRTVGSTARPLARRRSAARDDVLAGLAQRRLDLLHVDRHVGPDEGRALLRVDERDRERAWGTAVARDQLEGLL